MRLNLLLGSALAFSLLSCASPNKVYQGYDVNGQKRSCMEMSPEKVCTSVQTPSDNHAYQCRMNGRKAIQCGCHDWICL